MKPGTSAIPPTASSASAKPISCDSSTIHGRAISTVSANHALLATSATANFARTPR